jgi:hypothetical protein
LYFTGTASFWQPKLTLFFELFYFSTQLRRYIADKKTVTIGFDKIGNVLYETIDDDMDLFDDLAANEDTELSPAAATPKNTRRLRERRSDPPKIEYENLPQNGVVSIEKMMQELTSKFPCPRCAGALTVSGV